MYAVRRIHAKDENRQPSDEGYRPWAIRSVRLVEDVMANRGDSDEVVMYWRKANHIHAWFVDNVQNGVDDCGSYEVSEDQLTELYKVCETVIASSTLVGGENAGAPVKSVEQPNGLERQVPPKLFPDPTVAQALLPRRTGSFFGSMEYDEKYLEDVVATRDWLRSMFDDMRPGFNATIIYSASW